ncbi:MAG: ABC transporter substrate-binding protein [Magnetospirillum sp.]|nr:ABC transporter substrate-binding protein [Magnetospirillum sp.]
MMRRRWSAVIAVLAGLACAEGEAAPPASRAEPAIVVGVVATLSGPEGVGGRDALDGFRLALKDLGQRFGNQEVRVVEIDDKGAADVALAETRRLIERDHPQFVVTAIGPASLSAVLPILSASRTFAVNLGGTTAAMAGAGCSMWLFDIAGLADGDHEAAGAQMAADRVGRLVVVGPDSAPTQDAVAALRRTFPGEVAAVVTPPHGATVYTRELAQIRTIKPDAVYDLLTGGMGVEFVRAWGQSALNGKVPLYAPWWGFERTSLAAIGDAAAGVTTFGSWSPDLDNPASHRLVAEYEAEYGRPATTWAAQGYDAGTLLDAALKSTKGATSNTDAVRLALLRADFPSVRGPIRFGANHFPVLTYYSRKVVHDAKGRLVSESRAIALKDWHDRYAPACPMRLEEAPKPKAAADRKKG